MAKGTGRSKPKGKASLRDRKAKNGIAHKQKKWTVAQKVYACKLKAQGLKYKQIKAKFEDHYKVDTIGSSTLATFYNKKNMKRYRDLISDNLEMEKWLSDIGRDKT